VTTSSKAVASREFQQTDQFFDLGLIQPMQRLVYLVPNGGVEFLQEIEPRLGDVTKNLSAVIGGRPGAASSSLPADPASGLYPDACSIILSAMSSVGSPPGLRLAGCAGRCIAER